MASVEYHHYIPQFLLRNFAHPYKATSKKKKQHDPSLGPRMYPGNPVLNVVDLSTDDLKLVEKLVKCTFGQNNMYKDNTAMTKGQQDRVEKKLGWLEQAASQIFKKIVNAHASNQQEVQLSPEEHFRLVQFVFVMKYRSTVFFRRYNHERSENYNENDKDKMLRYMRKKNYRRPIDVWFDNLIEIIDMPVLHSDECWLALQGRMYPSDAMWAQATLGLTYPVLCTPSAAGEEFIVTEHAYCLHEGLVNASAYTEFHNICIISPHLALLLRNDVLPESLENKDAAVQLWKEQERARLTSMHQVTNNVVSILEDLPVVKPRSTYTKDEDGELLFTISNSNAPTASDTLYLPLSSIDTKHVQTINSVILEEAFDLNAVAYNSKSALLLALEHYLSIPESSGNFRMKLVHDLENDPKLLYLKKLERVARSLGSNVAAKYNVAMVYRIKTADKARAVNNLLMSMEAELEAGKAQAEAEAAHLRNIIDRTLVDFVNYGYITDDDDDEKMCGQFLLKIGMRQGGVGRPSILSLMAKADDNSSLPDQVYEGIQSSVDAPARMKAISKELWRKYWTRQSAQMVNPIQRMFYKQMDAIKQDRMAEAVSAFTAQTPKRIAKETFAPDDVGAPPPQTFARPTKEGAKSDKPSTSSVRDEFGFAKKLHHALAKGLLN